MTTIKNQIEKELLDSITITKIIDTCIYFVDSYNQEFSGRLTKTGKYKKNSSTIMCY